MRDIIEILLDKPKVSYSVATVSAVSVPTGRVTIAMGSTTIPGVPYLLSYSPTVGDKVQILGGDPTGLLVLGKTLATASAVAPTTRTGMLAANRSMTWIDAIADVDPDQAVDGLVRQGADVSHLYSGAYSYPSGVITLASDEIIVKAELLLYRVDIVPAGTVVAVLHELTGYAADGSPVYDVPNSFLSSDMKPGDVVWLPIPTQWAGDIVGGIAPGLAFAPNSALYALTYAEFAAYTTNVDGTSTAGTLRLTIEKGA